ncbi:uncharacterized protein L969DRAFT_94843 [Mixia osmundae IAM 14324]|uniref:CipC-like antibiotic response protein n=1 Tax=Mixia osmundae (strain CBS 9802 / IAM 14324 / JCM 22182 / KY 12970) TaxID=764103 RepID=G7DVN5_MIXOS|nr:uncharacterized protein L969DRAFT_94843 [Mixia osmundae IAM 14324]KEI38640.1 hypothetical protein L969DRAFT_94843 [Mixia osmundae IAM 14324]GAA94645.1 hypothetical protein E5Q_01298 [Mixia osmundae IAM 14324]
MKRRTKDRSDPRGKQDRTQLTILGAQSSAPRSTRRIDFNKRTEATMGFFSHDSDEQRAHQEVYQGGEQHKSKFSHELLASAVSFAAVHEYEERQKKEGKPVKHEFAKEMIGGIVGAETDKLFETKGLNEFDREKVKYEARNRAERQYDNY